MVYVSLLYESWRRIITITTFYHIPSNIEDLQKNVRMMQKGIQHLRCRNLENLHPSCRFVEIECLRPYQNFTGDKVQKDMQFLTNAYIRNYFSLSFLKCDESYNESIIFEIVIMSLLNRNMYDS